MTFSSTAPGITLGNNGSITIGAVSLVSTAATPITFTAAPTGFIQVMENAALTVGSAKGNLAFGGVNTGSLLELYSTANLTINSAINFGNVQLAGGSVINNSTVTALSSYVDVVATGKSGVITTPNGGSFVSANTVSLAQTSATLAKTPIAINATFVQLGIPSIGGALNINNTNGSADTVVMPSPSISALTYTSSTATATTLNSFDY